MTNEQILKKVIEKTEKNGWDFFGKKNKKDFSWEIDECMYLIHSEKLPFLQMYWKEPEWMWVERHYGANIWEIIFNKDFAKAFWGEQKLSSCDECFLKGFSAPRYCPKCLKAWQHHLQQLVLEEDPLKYIEKFL